MLCNKQRNAFARTHTALKGIVSPDRFGGSAIWKSPETSIGSEMNDLKITRAGRVAVGWSCMATDVCNMTMAQNLRRTSHVCDMHYAARQGSVACDERNKTLCKSLRALYRRRAARVKFVTAAHPVRKSRVAQRRRNLGFLYASRSAKCSARFMNSLRIIHRRAWESSLVELEGSGSLCG